MNEERSVLPVLVGFATGLLVASLQRHPRRVLGFVPYGFTGLSCLFAWMAGVGASMSFSLLPFAFFVTLTSLPLARAALSPTAYRAPGKVLVVVLAALLLTIVLLACWPVPWLTLFIVSLAGTIVAWYALLSQAIELTIELLLLPIYRIRAHGPGAGRLPRTGPLLMVANHSSYMDPFWVGKIVPRHLTPMMTSMFFDRPVIHWLMVHVVGAIRVEASPLRREAPELADAVKVLRQGGCVLVFPEAVLRKSDEQLLRSFGQGVWHILHELPETPVAVCWIEGGWGSYMSHKGGPPLVNKRPDWWRRIDIAVADPKPLDPAVLVDHRTTRTFLQQACAACRGHLGLPVPDDAGRLPEDDTKAIHND